MKKLAILCDQPGAADDLLYHLTTRFAANKIPTLLLMPPQCSCDPSVEDIGAAVLLFEYTIFGVRSWVYATSDITGRRTVIGPGQRRAELAAVACRFMMMSGARIVLVSLREHAPGAVRKAFEHVLGTRHRNGVWSLVERDAQIYLSLKETFDATLATIGKKTRTNLRYYRKRAEKELGCTFVPEVEMSLEEFLEVSRQSAFPVGDKVARWRHESLKRIHDPLFCGIRDRDGRWLSIVGGRRSEGDIELDWQSNRADLPAYSLSTVLRAYLIEHEVGRGSSRLYVGGTRSPLQRSFTSERVADVTLCRRFLVGWLVRSFAGWLFPERIQLTQVLKDQSILWHQW